MDEDKIVISIYYKDIDENNKSKAYVCKDIENGGFFIEYTNDEGDVQVRQDCGNWGLQLVEDVAESWALSKPVWR
jgi:hypothetical protein|tara:strand:+ start:417 stop:641 length:225 start_codon:yes stop_codon:yes gene_type:complete